MRQNIQLGLERGTNLDVLQGQAGRSVASQRERESALADMLLENLNIYSQQFAHGAQRVNNKFWWQNVKVCRL